jgi:hypothetical protein
MGTAIYIVFFARDAWWVDLDGHSYGPFGSDGEATSDAISRASTTSASGGRSEVQLSRPGRDNELVYQSASRSLLSRTVAAAQR